MIKLIQRPNPIYRLSKRVVPPKSALSSQWWQFQDEEPRAPATGVFTARDVESLGRLYFPLANDAGMLSWTSPRLQGGPALSHHEHLSPPLTAEDLPHTLIHRDFWVTEEGREPVSLSGLSPAGLIPPVSRQGTPPAVVTAGPGWFMLTRRDRALRFTVQGALWCPADLPEPLECFHVEVRNTSSRPLAITPYAAIPLFARSADNVRDHRHVTSLLHRAAILPHGVVVCPTMSFDERGHRLNRTRYAVLAFGPGGGAPEGVWASQEEFLGEGGTFAAPDAVWRGRRTPASGRRRTAGEAIGGFRMRPLRLRPGQRATYLFVSGITHDPRRVSRWIRLLGSPERARRSLLQTKAVWLSKIHRAAFLTADRQLDQWLTWVAFQPMLRRLYGNSYLPQFDYGRGGRGWRDLWQDCLALLLTEPSATRSMLLQNFGGVRIDGSNATIIGPKGEFIADRNNIPRTWMDHGAWPAFTTLLYLDQTGDTDFLLEEREYFRDAHLFRCRGYDPTWSERLGFHLRTRGGRVYRGSLLEHLLVQTLTAFFNVGGHNLCRLEGADWNDGLDMAAERGESVAFSAFYAWNLARLAGALERLAERGRQDVPLAEELVMLLDRMPGRARIDYRSAAAKQRVLERFLQRVSHGVFGRTVRISLIALAADLLAKSRDLAGRIRTQEWVRAGGQAFFNGYYDNAGRRVEGRRGGRVRMTLTGQVFPVMSGIATDAQVEDVIRSVNRFLRDPRSGGIRLNTDFGEPQMKLGRAFSFAYGEKENGAVFSHMAVMYASALYHRRRPHEGRRAWHSLYRMAVNQPVARIFPGLPEYFNLEGRGMYGYLTGSASWLMFLLLTQMYGVRGEEGDLILDPQLTLEDFGRGTAVTVHAAFAGRPLRITLANPRRLDAGRYRVSQVRAGSLPLPFAVRPEGGVRIPRGAIERLSRDTPTDLRLTLAPLR